MLKLHSMNPDQNDPYILNMVFIASHSTTGPKGTILTEELRIRYDKRLGVSTISMQLELEAGNNESLAAKLLKFSDNLARMGQAIADSAEKPIFDPRVSF